MPNYGSTMIIFIVFGVIFLILGIALYVESDKVQQAEIQYSEACKNQTSSSYCYLTFTLAAPIPAPVYVYYEMENFYQNHRRYVNSRSSKQLMGQVATSTEAQLCTPVITNE